jgi:dTDP-4-dehydrorhamnose 3,5-epimerase
MYQVSEVYSPAHGRGMRYDDPAFGIDWPIGISVISEQDRLWPPYGIVETVERDEVGRGTR